MVQRTIIKVILFCIMQAWQHWTEGTIHELRDPILQDDYLEEITKCVNVALLCVQDNPFNRPNMESINVMLGSSSGAVRPVFPSMWSFSKVIDMSISEDDSVKKSEREVDIII